jgi:hypothetical protein
MTSDSTPGVGTMKACMIALLAALGCTVSLAQAPESPPSDRAPSAKRVVLDHTYNVFTKSGIGFLSPGKSYVISFPSEEQHFISTTARVSPNPKRTKELTGQEYEIKKSKLEVFTIVQLSGDSWAEVEYPERGSDYGSWNLKLNAQAVLADESLLKKLEEDVGLKDHLRYFRWAAEQPIATRKTWINLNHAIAISDLRRELIFRRVTAGPPIPVPVPEEAEVIEEAPTQGTPPVLREPDFQGVEPPTPVNPN